MSDEQPVCSQDNAVPASDAPVNSGVMSSPHDVLSSLKAWHVEHGDCLAILRTLPPDSIDAVVTDPPYELNFMGRAWDRSGIAFQPETWAEVMRVLKPGGHLLAFGGSRTYHRIACAIEDAGFDIRDSIHWTYGSGFPKSLDIGKAIDKRGGNPHLSKEIGDAIKAARVARGLTVGWCDGHFCGGSTNWSWFEGRQAGQRPPTPETFNKIVDEWPELSNLRDAVAQAERETIGTANSSLGGTVAAGERDQEFIAEHRTKVYDITAPATPAAKQWSGWGTALKPSHEPIILARKPLSAPNVASNVLQWGTGGINVDGCRVGTADNTGRLSGSHNKENWRMGSDHESGSHPSGRWPANTLLSHAESCAESGETWDCEEDCPVLLMDAQSGNGASRFFTVFEPEAIDPFVYQAKASRSERNAGCEGMEERTADPYGEHRGRRMEDKSRIDGKPAKKAENFHPTVKPLALMRHLVRLITPPGGIVLDPFNGSGSTGCAAVLEGMRYVGCEQDADYVAIARARIAHWEREAAKPVKQAKVKKEKKAKAEQGTLYAA